MRRMWQTIVPLIVSLHASVGFANRYRDNPWFPVDRRADGFYNAIGVIETKNVVYTADGSQGHGQANAWLISPCYAITNNHAVFGDAFPAQPRTDQERDAISQAYPVTFSVGVGKTVPFAGSVTAIPVRWGRRTGTQENDWALLKLNSCLGTRSEIGWLPINVNQSAGQLHKEKSIVKVVFFDTAGSEAPGRDALHDDSTNYESFGCVYGYNEENKTIRYSASTYYGVSGAPVMYWGKDGMEAVIGGHRGGHLDFTKGSTNAFKKYHDTYTEDESNEFINIRDVVQSQDVRDILNKDFLAYGRGNPYPRYNVVRPPLAHEGAKACLAEEPGHLQCLKK